MIKEDNYMKLSDKLLVVLLALLLLALPLLIACDDDDGSPVFGGLASVTLQDGVFSLSWVAATDDNTEQASILYEVFETQISGIENYDFLNPVASTVGAISIDVSGLDTTKRHYFIVRARDGQNNSEENAIEQVDRVVHLEGHPNFRDFGGYINSEGKQVRWGMLYRSGELSALTDDDVVMVDNLGLNRVCDLRAEFEVAEEPDRIYEGNEAIYDILPFNLDPSMEGITNWFVFDPRLVDTPNMYFNTAERNKENYKKIFDRYADLSQYAVLEHCTGGKDRAGTTAALLLLLLDVPEETIVEDYLLTCELRDPQSTIDAFAAALPVYEGVPEGVTIDDWKPLIGCPEEAMRNLLDRMETEYGGVEGYLESIGVTAEQQQTIRDILLKD